MPSLEREGVSLFYETLGNPQNPPAILIAGLGGAGKTWGNQINLFAEKYHVVLPDHRGTGKSGRPADGYTTQALADDMAAILRHLDVSPAHVVGSSTGGAIAQWMALEHPDRVRSLVISSSLAKADPYFRREFEFRKRLVLEAEKKVVYSAYALFLFSPEYIAKNPEVVDAWVNRAIEGPEEREIAAKRIDMVLAHDCSKALDRIRKPTLVLGGGRDFCTPPHLSQELHRGIPGSKSVRFPDGGHMIHLEQEQLYFETVHSFLASQS